MMHEEELPPESRRGAVAGPPADGTQAAMSGSGRVATGHRIPLWLLTIGAVLGLLLVAADPAAADQDDDEIAAVQSDDGSFSVDGDQFFLVQKKGDKGKDAKAKAKGGKAKAKDAKAKAKAKDGKGKAKKDAKGKAKDAKGKAKKKAEEELIVYLSTDRPVVGRREMFLGKES